MRNKRLKVVYVEKNKGFHGVKGVIIFLHKRIRKRLKKGFKGHFMHVL